MLVLVIIMFCRQASNNGEQFDLYSTGNKKSCNNCTTLMEPNMYQSFNGEDPFSWGQTYSTGKCPHWYS